MTRIKEPNNQIQWNPLYKGHPIWWPFKRGGLSWGVKWIWFVKNSAWKWTKFCNKCVISACKITSSVFDKKNIRIYKKSSPGFFNVRLVWFRVFWKSDSSLVNYGFQEFLVCCACVRNMKLTNRYTFRVITSPLWGESTGHRWIRLTKTSDTKFWSFLWSAPEQMVKQTIETPVIWDAIAPIMTLL